MTLIVKVREKVEGRIKMERKFVCDWVFFRRRREFIGTTFFWGGWVLFIYSFSLTIVSASWLNFHVVSPRGELPFYLASYLLSFIF